ncbi:hypothetical protein NQ317_004480 [Molorchus minor]|uniref:Uncharacterized protein n=1 Tax=Molorchus minor TaxID=1323400 RepID=A0ABQ9J8T9_9CUCU|nr:hypothetical protein NQ317_004480 [Molorchus minor]
MPQLTSETKKAIALIVSLRGDALEIQQTLNKDKYKNYEDLVLHLEMRFGDKNLQVYQAQLKGRNQRMTENLQQYEADIACLVYLAYPTAPQDFIEQFSSASLHGIRDCETQYALRLARCKNLNEVLAYTLEFEATKQASRGHTRIRQIRTKTPEREYRSNNTYNRNNFKDDVENLRQDIKDIQTWKRSSYSTTSGGPGKRQLASFPWQNLARFFQTPLSKTKVSRWRYDGTSLVVYGKACGRECQMVIDTGSYHTRVNPNIVAHGKMKPTTNNVILETAGGETLSVIGVHEADFS